MAPQGRRNRGQGTRRGNTGQEGSATASSGNARQGNATYDGPSDTRGRSPSNTGQPQPVRASSRARSGSRGPETSQQVQRRDPARDPSRPRRELLRNVDFGGSAYNIIGGTGYVSVVLSYSTPSPNIQPAYFCAHFFLIRAYSCMPLDQFSYPEETFTCPKKSILYSYSP